MKSLFFAMLFISLFSSCIGTDLVEETEVSEQIIISTNISSIKIGDEVQMEAFLPINMALQKLNKLFGPHLHRI